MIGSWLTQLLYYRNTLTRRELAVKTEDKIGPEYMRLGKNFSDRDYPAVYSQTVQKSSFPNLSKTMLHE